MNQTQKTVFSPTLDTHAYRRTIGLFATGVTVIASGEGEQLRAMTANAVSSLSLDPMLLLVCVHKEARFTTQLQRGEGFSVNILRQEQQALSNYFAGGWKAETPPDFAFVSWHGVPRLQGCVATVGCKLYQRLEGGDHWIVIGHVVALHQGAAPLNPLVFYRGRYRELASEPQYEIPVVWDFGW